MYFLDVEIFALFWIWAHLYIEESMVRQVYKFNCANKLDSR